MQRASDVSSRLFTRPTVADTCALSTVIFAIPPSPIDDSPLCTESVNPARFILPVGHYNFGPIFHVPFHASLSSCPIVHTNRLSSASLAELSTSFTVSLATMERGWVYCQRRTNGPPPYIKRMTTDALYQRAAGIGRRALRNHGKA